MSDKPIDINDFINPPSPEPETEVKVEEKAEIVPPEEAICDELDIQKTVVEQLAADKAVLDQKVEDMSSQASAIKLENQKLQEKLASSETEISELNAKLEAAKSKIAELESKLAAEAGRRIDEQDRNPNALALLDRDIELPDRFPGETRDHVLEVITEARVQAEKEGRCRRAQLLESVLVANEPNGELAKRRADLEKLFTEHGNVIDGVVLAELSKLGISHKNGEEYLLADEIKRRSY